MNEALPQVYLVRHGETAWSISGQHTGRTDIPPTEWGEHAAQELSVRLNGLSFVTRADRVIARIRALKSDVLVSAHRDILRILIARWVALPPFEARRLYLTTVSVSTLGYDHGLDEPVIRLLNDARHA